MNMSPQDQGWEEGLRASLGTAPAPDFDAWCKRHPDATAAIKSLAPPTHTQGLSKYIDRRTVMTISKLVAASLLIVCGLMWIGSDNNTLSQSAFANAIPGVDNVQTMTWTTTFYIRCFSKDGKESCIKKERRLHAYRHPGQYRETFLDQNNQPISIWITDYRAGRMLQLDLKEKKAVLKIPPFSGDMRGPFAWVGDMVRKNVGVSLQGLREIDNVHANLIRKISRGGANQVEQHVDCFFDPDTKQLVGVWSNDEAGLEFDTELEENDIPIERWYRVTGAGCLRHEIVLDAKLTADDFSLDPPADYKLEKLAKPTVSEDEMIAYLGAAARFNDDSFPLSPYHAFDSNRFNVASFKEAEERTEVEQALIDIRDKIMLREIYQSPVKRFEEDQTVPNSFYYVGTGVKVGQADKIVGWYKLRQGKQLRAFYGDLSVRDITESDLPMNLLEQ